VGIKARGGSNPLSRTIFFWMKKFFKSQTTNFVPPIVAVLLFV